LTPNNGFWKGFSKNKKKKGGRRFIFFILIFRPPFALRAIFNQQTKILSKTLQTMKKRLLLK
jgi:hypothetical protein